jgi:hypothetical protein
MLHRSLAVLIAIPLLALPARGQGVATVCKDGTTTATTGRGACTGHGGVDKKAAKQNASVAKAEKAAASTAAAPASIPAGPAAAPVMKPATVPARRAAAAPVRAAAPPAAHTSSADPTGATAQCKDGTYSHSTSHRGACARHQGVAKWL